MSAAWQHPEGKMVYWLILFALGSVFGCTVAPAIADDHVVLVIQSMQSLNLSNLNQPNQCRLSVEVQNLTHYPLGEVKFALKFPKLDSPAKGTIGGAFAPKWWIESGQRGFAFAIWTGGFCQDGHYNKPSIVIDSCQLGGLPEDVCRQTISVQTALQRPLPASPGGYVEQPLTDLALKDVDCKKLGDTNVNVVLQVSQFGGMWDATPGVRPQKAFDLTLARNFDLGSFRLDDHIKTWSLVNGFEVSSTESDGSRHKFSRSIDEHDLKYLKEGQYKYDLSIDRWKATVTRSVKEIGERAVGGCRFRVISVSEELRAPNFGQRTLYYWYPDLKLRIDTMFSRQRYNGYYSGLVEDKIWHYRITGLRFQE